MINKLTSNIILLILSGIVAVLLILLSITKYNNINDTSLKIEQQTQKLQENRIRLARLKKLEVVRPQLEKALAFLKKQIPERPYEEQILQMLEQKSINNSSDFVLIQFLERVNSNSINEMPLQLTFGGRYKSLVNVLENMASGERLFRIEEIQMTKTDNKSDYIAATISAVAFSK